jgi:pimeloyl-ACP methyl ester carboxylesterase
MALFSRTVGTTGPRVVMLHGLLGQGRNLATAAQALAERGHVVTTYVLPGHGRSPWPDHLDYDVLAGAVADELAALDGPVVLLGHSMGGKTAMLLALRRPELVSGLVVVDIAPVTYEVAGETEHDRHLRTMRAMDLAALDSRSDADALLAAEVGSARVRGFLLQNLAREGDAWTWRAHLDVLARDLPGIAGFPDVDAVYDGPALFLAGGDSDYVTDAHRDRILELFPQSRVVRFKGVGHWVHSEAPDLFVDAVAAFVKRVTDRE